MFLTADEPGLELYMETSSLKLIIAFQNNRISYYRLWSQGNMGLAISFPYLFCGKHNKCAKSEIRSTIIFARVLKNPN